MRPILSLLLILALTHTLYATEWFVRTDGGTPAQCTGKANAPYPSTGTAQPCGFKNLQDGLNAVQYGDTLTVRASDTFTAPSTGMSYVLPAKSGTPAHIIIRTSDYIVLPVGRVSPADAVHMFKVVALGYGGALRVGNGAKYWKVVGAEITNATPSSLTAWTGDFNYCGTLVKLEEATDSHHITFERSFLHPQEYGTTNYDRTAARGFGINGVDDVMLTGNYIAGFVGYPKHVPDHSSGIIDSEAIASNISHRVTVSNNYLGAYFNPIFLGGGGVPGARTGVVQPTPVPTRTTAGLSTVAGLAVGDYISFPQPNAANANGRVTGIAGTTITYTPLHRIDGAAVAPVAGSVALWNGEMISDWTITQNTIYLNDDNFAQAIFDQTFNGSHAQMPKAYVEIKHCNNCLFEGNVFDGFVASFAINSVNQSGDAPWTVVKNFTFRNNWIKQFGNAISWAGGNPDGSGGGHMAAESTGIVFTNNLFTQANNLGGEYGTTRIGSWGYGSGFTFTHNTFRLKSPGGSNIIAVNTGGPIRSFIFRDNIIGSNHGDFFCSQPPLINCFPGWIDATNVIVNNSGGNLTADDIKFAHPDDFAVPDSLNPLPWVGTDPSLLANSALASNSAYNNAASDRADVGVDINALKAALGGAITPPPQPTPTPAPPTPTPTPVPTPSPSPSVTPPTQPCAIGSYCMWTWPASQSARAAALDNVVRYGCDPATVVQTGSYIYARRVH